jgi:23S rRNA pseudouridine1911/1915/1917 synthase
MHPKQDNGRSGHYLFSVKLKTSFKKLDYFYRQTMILELEVLYEDNHVIAINKKCGDIVQADSSEDPPLSQFICDYIREKYQKPGNVFVGVIHRIDRPVSGVVLFARTSKGLARMNNLFKEKTIQKTYWAVVKNKPPQTSGTLKHFIIKDENIKKAKLFHKEVPGSKYCELTYELIGQSDNYYLLEVKPITGRFHQIRAQLSSIGCPIKGDLKYGFDRSNPNAGIHLHARKIEFIHPVKQEPVEITAPVPKDDELWQYFEKAVGG